MPQGLRVRKLAGEDGKERVKGYDPRTGEKVLIDADSGKPSPKPLLGVMLLEPIPREARIPMRWLMRARAEGWAVLTDERIVFRPGGPPEDPLRATHAFMQAAEIVFRCVDGDVVYRVTHQPDKYEDRVDWFYDAELVTGG